MEFIGFPLATVLDIVVLIAVVATTIYAVMFGYHWFTFGSSRTTSMTAMVTFLLGAILLIGAMFFSTYALR